MSKKIIAIFLAMTMIFSMLLLSSCDDEKTREKNESDESEAAIVLTPKEKFLTTADAAATYFNELNSALGYTATNYTVSDDKMEVATLGVELNKLAMGGTNIIEEPIGITAQTTVDQKNNTTKALMELAIGDTDLPIEMLITEAAAYFNIEDVTEKMLKFPFEGEMPDFDIEQIEQIANTYYDTFMDSFSSDLFTETKGDVTVDGVAISNATTINAKITEAQLLTAMKSVLEKAKTDLQIKSIVDSFTALAPEEEIEDYETLIGEAITALEGEIAEAKDSQYFTIAIVFEGETLRSVAIEIFGDDGKTESLTMTTVKKDSSYYVKGAAIGEDDEKVLEFSYEQTANTSGSADGKLEITVPEQVNVVAEFKGTKTDNKLVIDTDITFSTTMEDIETSIPLNVVTTYEKVSDTENSTSLAISMDALTYEIELTLSSNIKLVDYAAIEVPSDGEVDEIDETYDYEALVMQIMTAYPEIGQFLSGLMGGGATGEPTGITLYTEDYTETVNLYNDGTGSLVNTYENITYGDGAYSAEYAGEEYTGTYSVSGNSVTINDVTGFTMEEFDGYTSIVDAAETTYITFYADNTCSIEYLFTYTLENNLLDITYLDGDTATLDCVNNGDTYTINELEYYWEYMYY